MLNIAANIAPTTNLQLIYFFKESYEHCYILSTRKILEKWYYRQEV